VAAREGGVGGAAAVVEVVHRAEAVQGTRGA
jgi:hypothetical protein